MIARATLFASFCLMALPASAQAQEGVFSITVSGFKAGTLSIAANSNASSYAVTSRAASAGLTGLFRSFTITSKVTGRLSGGAFRPERYVAQSDGARAGRGAELAFENGTPRVISAATEPDPEAPKIDPSSLKDVVDPLTGLYAVLRDAAPEAVCRVDLMMFDGHRVSRVTLSGARAVEEGVLCDGVYRRVAGYPPKELAKRDSFAFTALFVPEGEMLRVQELTMDSLFGPARMTRD